MRATATMPWTILDQAARDLDILDRGAVRGTIERVGRQIDTGVAASKAGDPVALPDDDDEELVVGRSIGLIDEQEVVGDVGGHWLLDHRLIDYIGPPQGPKAAFLGAFGGYLIRAGDPEGGRVLIERASGRLPPDPKARAFTLPILAGDLFEAAVLTQSGALPRDGARCRQPPSGE